MSIWKQAILCIVILLAAAAAWVRFVPGASQQLAGWGIDLAWAAAAPEPATPQGQSNGRRNGGQNAQAPVITAPVTVATINDRLQAIGTGRANASVTVTPYASGRLTEILVEAGARVEKGAVLARLDAEAEQIALDRARIALDDAKAKADRIKALRSSNTASVVQLTEAELAVSNAELALRDAELTLDRRSIVAPISGVVGLLPVEAGNYVTSQTAIATIDDRSRIVVDFWVPERYAAAMKVGEPVTASPIARPSETAEGVVRAIDNRIDEQSRTLQVQAGLSNPDDSLRAGMSFQVSMSFAGDSFPAVNPLAIQWGTDGAFVWAVKDGKAKRTPVKIVQRNTESVLVQAELGEGDQVVTEGIYSVREGAPLTIAGSENNPPAPAPVPVAGGPS